VAIADPAVIIAPLALPADFVHAAPGWIEFEIEVEIRTSTSNCCAGKNKQNLFEMPHSGPVSYRDSADRLAAVAQGLDQQFSAPDRWSGLPAETARRQVDRPGIVALQRLHRLETAQPDAGIDFDMVRIRVVPCKTAIPYDQSAPAGDVVDRSGGSRMAPRDATHVKSIRASGCAFRGVKALKRDYCLGDRLSPCVFPQEA